MIRSATIAGMMFATAAAAEPVVLVAPDVPPFFHDAAEDGAIGGVAVDWFRRVAGAADVAWTATLEPPARAIARLRRGDGHVALLTDGPDLVGVDLLRRDEPVASVMIDAYWLVEKPPIAVVADLRGRMLGVLAGDDYGGLLAANALTPRIATASPLALLRVLERGRVDVAVLYRATYAAAVRRLGRTPRGVARTELSRSPIFLYVRRDAPGGGVRLLGRLDAAIRRLDVDAPALSD